MATKHEVIALHRKYPALNSVEIAERLGCMPEYVRRTAVREGLSLAKGKKGPKRRKAT